MELNEKIAKLENAGFDWFQIAEITDSHYDEVRTISEEEFSEPQEKEEHALPMLTLGEMSLIVDSLKFSRKHSEDEPTRDLIDPIVENLEKEIKFLENDKELQKL